MRIFRVEDLTGDGPYSQSGPLYGQFRHDEPNPLKRTEQHHSPFENDPLRDMLLRLGGFTSYVYGFDSKGQAREWFSRERWRKAMALAGFYLTEWEVDPGDVIEGYKQVMFIRGKGTLIARHSLWNAPAKH